MEIATGIAAAKQGLEVVKTVRDHLKGEQVDKTETANRLQLVTT